MNKALTENIYDREIYRKGKTIKESESEHFYKKSLIGMCEVTWQVLQPWICRLSKGELVQPSGTWLKDDTKAVFTCVDGVRPVTFLLEAQD